LEIKNANKLRSCIRGVNITNIHSINPSVMLRRNRASGISKDKIGIMQLKFQIK
jgi:hypothetical protein